MSGGSKLVVGISGATCSGKTTVVRLLKSVFPSATTFNQDGYYHPIDDTRHIRCETLNHINWELVTAFDNERLCADIRAQTAKHVDQNFDVKTVKSAIENLKNACKNKESILNATTKELNPDVVSSLKSVSNLSVVFVEGITLFNHEELANLCSIKFFLTLNHETCAARRKLRNYDPPDVEGYFEQVVWPAYLDIKSATEKKFGDQLIEIDGSESYENIFETVVEDILKKIVKK